MKYEFQANDGTIIERDYPMKDAPPFGTVIEVDGKRYERVVSKSVQVDMRFTDSHYPVVSNSLPRNLKGYEKDHLGRPVIHNKREHDRIHKECGLIRDV